MQLKSTPQLTNALLPDAGEVTRLHGHHSRSSTVKRPDLKAHQKRNTNVLVTPGLFRKSSFGHQQEIGQSLQNPLRAKIKACQAAKKNRAAKIEAFKNKMKADLQRVMQRLQKLPEAITIFGGARLRPGDEDYEKAVELGRLLAELGIPPRTGAGPGAMEAVALGFKEAQKNKALLGMGLTREQDLLETQGFSIVLPEEGRISQAIDINLEVQLFPFRKLGLYENSLGLINVRGGFGTNDEFFEVLTLAAQGWHNDPIVALGSKFWSLLLDPIERVFCRDRPLIDPKDLQRVFHTDSAKAAVDFVARNLSRGFEEDPAVASPRMSEELGNGLQVVKHLAPAVLFDGADALAEDDPAIRVITRATQLIAAGGGATRVGRNNPVALAVAKGIPQDSFKIRPQALLRKHAPSHHALDIRARFSDHIVHREVLSQSITALVLAPGDLNTLDLLFSILTEIQTGKRPPIPIILVGDEKDWGQVVEGMRQAMFPDLESGGEERVLTIAHEDMDLITVCNDPVEIADRVLQSKCQAQGASNLRWCSRN